MDGLVCACNLFFGCPFFEVDAFTDEGGGGFDDCPGSMVVGAVFTAEDPLGTTCLDDIDGLDFGHDDM